jgi:hypothetical protein
MPIGELFAADSQTRLIQPAGAGMSVVPGSELAAGIAPGRLKLYRGGQVRLCPHTSMSVNSGRLGLMFAMNAGSVEVDYSWLQRGADFLMTPDFSIQLQAPGKYHFAIGTNSKGDTCVKTLPGNTGYLQFSELMSAATHRLGPADSAIFHNGKLENMAPLPATETCGCPETAPTVETSAQLPPAQQESARTQSAVASKPDQTQPLPPDYPGQVHVEVDAPFVFSAKNVAGVEPYSVAKVQLSTLPNVFFVQETVDPIVLPEKPAQVSAREEPPAQVQASSPPAPAKKPRKGLFGKLKGIFTGIFHR